LEEIDQGDIFIGDRLVNNVLPKERDIAMVFQSYALFPNMDVADNIAYGLKVRGDEPDKIRARVDEMLAMMQIEELRSRPINQLSGGQKQRVVIAMALSCNPDLLILDEPTTGLDVTTEATILDLINELRARFDSAILFISHNLGVIAKISDRIGVLYAGRMLETGPVQSIFLHPLHPYTEGLLNCIPKIQARSFKKRLEPIKGVVPDPYEVPDGCGFEPRCPHAMEICKTKMPDLKEVLPGHDAACWLYE